MRKAAGIILTVWLGAIGAGSAGATTDDVDLGDPKDAIEDLVDGIDFVNSGSGAVDVAGARGTAWSAVTGVKIASGSDPADPDVELRVLDTLVSSTTDHERIEAPKNFARGQAMLGSFFVRHVLRHTNGGPYRVPEQPMHGESFNGENEQRYCLDPMPAACVGEQLVQFPVTTYDGGTVNWDGLSRDVGGLVGLIAAIGDDGGNLVVPLPTGNQPLTIGTGSLVDGLLRPAAIDTAMKPTGSLARVESSIKSLVMLDGLTSFQEAGPGSQTSVTNNELADAETKLFKIEHMTVLQTDALFHLLGLDAGQLPDGTLAELGDALGIHTGRFAQTIAGARNWSSVKEMQQGLAVLKRSVDNALGAGASCDLLDDIIRTEQGFDPYEEAEKYGVERPDCLGLLGALDQFVAALNRLQDDLHAALVNSVGEEAVLSIADLSASVKAMASVTDDALTQGSGVHGGIQHIRAGGGDYRLDVLDSADAWNETEALVNTELNDVLDTFGPQFRDVVRVRLMPRLVQKGEVVDRRYLRSRAEMTLMQVMINVPSAGDVNQAAADLLAGVTEDAPSGGGGVGPLGRPDYARADFGDPITITIGQLSAYADHTNPGRTLDFCEAGVDVCDSSLVTTRWDPQNGWGPGPDSSTSLPRTGGAAGTLPIAAAAGLGAAAIGLRRLTRTSP